ncbi:MAG: hypothetical protein HYW88_03250 [Candidatus Sungbacteria bacterium]|nr:hypothetical protein [Candidatus Sungbacteria bacterium]
MDTKGLAREALVIIGQYSPEGFSTKRLTELYGTAETNGKWRILETLSKRSDCPTEIVLKLALDYSGEIGMTVLRVAIQPTLTSMTLPDLLINLSRPWCDAKQKQKAYDLDNALRYEIIDVRLPRLPIDQLLNISFWEDPEVVKAVKGYLKDRAGELRELAK